MNKEYKAIILGANGYIGSHLSLYLSNQGWNIYNYDIQPDSSFDNYKQIDIKDSEQLLKTDFNVDYVFLFSGITGTSSGFNNYKSFIDINEVGLLNVLNILSQHHNKPRVVYPSTRLVYKGGELPLKEDDEKEAKSIYAINKLACENYLKLYNNVFNIHYSIFRICVPYGNFFSSKYSYGTIGSFIEKATSGNPITLYGDGSLKRTYTYIEDICRQIEKCILCPSSVNEIFNIGGETFSLKEVAQRIASLYNVEVDTVAWPDMDLKIESGHTFFDDTKIKTAIGDIFYTNLLDLNWIQNG